MSRPEGSTSDQSNGSSLASFKRAVLLSRLEIGAAWRVTTVVCSVLDTGPAQRSDEEVERVLAYMGQQQLGRLQSCSEELLRAVCGRLTLVRLQPFHKLFSGGDQGDACYIVVHGAVEEVQDNTGPGKETVGRCIPKGECFGDDEGLNGLRRSFGIRCTAEECLLARLSRTDFVELLEAERGREIEVARSFLSSLHQLRRMPDDAMQQLATVAERVHFDRLAVVGAQGEKPDYIIIPTTEGDATLSVRAFSGSANHGACHHPEELSVATLAMKGEFIGLGLLFDDSYGSYRYPCSIVARVPIKALRVHREHAKRCFRFRPVIRVLRNNHYTRHSLTLDQIERLSGCKCAKADGSNSIRGANAASLGAAELSAPNPMSKSSGVMHWNQPPDLDGLSEAKSIDSIALRVKQYPPPAKLRTSVLASRSADFDRSANGPAESHSRTTRRSSIASSASKLSDRRSLGDSQHHHLGTGAKGHHASAFRVINDFVARSDGVLQRGSVTRISGFSVADDTITITVRASGDTTTCGRPSSAVRTRPCLLTCKTKSVALSGSWHIDLPQPRFSASAYTIEVTSARTSGRAEFRDIRWGDIAAGLGVDGLEVHSQLPLRYPSHALPLGAVALERKQRKAALEKESSLGSLSGMVTNLPDLDTHGQQQRQLTRARLTELHMLKMLRIPCAGNTLEERGHTHTGKSKHKSDGPRVYGRFPLDAYTSAA